MKKDLIAEATCAGYIVESDSEPILRDSYGMITLVRRCIYEVLILKLREMRHRFLNARSLNLGTTPYEPDQSLRPGSMILELAELLE